MYHVSDKCYGGKKNRKVGEEFGSRSYNFRVMGKGLIVKVPLE